MNNTIPWTEKYRPTSLETTVLDGQNRQLFDSMIRHDRFPHLMLCGPPGTGKTTTIINMIAKFQNTHDWTSTGSVIHLNASDERGIDIVRNQLYQFVRSKSLFQTSDCKFVVLDEVDHMTKTAQNALKYLVQTCSPNIRFCLICNYISKIDEALLDEFVCIRFNSLPRPAVKQYLQHIIRSESLPEAPDEYLNAVQTMFQSDVRSMVNYLQLHQGRQWSIGMAHLPNASLWKTFDALLREGHLPTVMTWVHNTSSLLNMGFDEMILWYFHYLIREPIMSMMKQQGEEVVASATAAAAAAAAVSWSVRLTHMEKIVRCSSCCMNTSLQYLIAHIHEF